MTPAAPAGRVRLASGAGLLLALCACDQGFADESRRFAEPLPAEERRYPGIVHEPSSLGVLDTPIVADDGGRDIPAGTACETCHGPVPDPELYAPPPRDETYHSGIEVRHGDLTCDQCHDQDRTNLRLADGTIVPFPDVVWLCGQCHGGQFRSFERGAHGGMNGYWDTRLGAQIQNNCVDCHAPHAPAYPSAMPVFPPRDRYLDVGGH